MVRYDTLFTNDLGSKRNLETGNIQNLQLNKRRSQGAINESPDISSRMRSEIEVELNKSKAEK